MKKKLICILIALLMLFLIGCSPSDQTDDTNNAGADAGQPTDGAPAEPIEPEPDASDAPIAPIEPDPVADDVVLTIFGDGVESQTNWTLEQLQALAGGYRETSYSVTNNWPTFTHRIGHGVSVLYLLGQAGVLDDAQTFIFLATDGYRVAIPREQLFGTQYSFATHSPEGSSGAQQVDPIIAWAVGDREAVPEDSIRLMVGQFGPRVVNAAASVRQLFRIQVSTQSAGTWADPVPSIPSGSVVEAGTALELTHPHLDNVRLYFTTDGSDPDFNSNVYNPSTTFFQPELIQPIIINEDITIRVFAGGFGKAESNIITLTFTVS